MYTCSMGLLLYFLFLYHSTVRCFACYSFLLLSGMYTQIHTHINAHINAHITSHIIKRDKWPGKKREREREQETALGRFTYLITTLTFIVWLKIFKRNNEPSRSRNVNSELRTSLNVNNFSHSKIPKMLC